MSGSSRPTMAFIEFKKQLASLSESLLRFDAVERSKALEILQECIQSFQNQHSFSLDEAIPEEVMNTVDAMTEDNQNSVVYCTLNEELCLQKNLPEVEQDECSECTVPGEAINSVDAISVERQNVVYCTLDGNLCLGKNLCIIERSSENNRSDCVVPEEVMNTVDAMNEDKQNDDGVLCALNEDLGLEENIPEVDTDDDSSECAVPEEVMKTVDAMTEDKENDDVFCNLNEDLGLEKNLSPVEGDDCSNCHLYEEMTDLMTETRQVKNMQYLSAENNCRNVKSMTLNERVEKEAPAFSPVQSPNLRTDARNIKNSKYLSGKNCPKAANESKITLGERIQENVLEFSPVSSPNLLTKTRKVENCEYLAEENSQKGSGTTTEDRTDKEVLEYRQVSSPNDKSKTRNVGENCEYLSTEENGEEVSTRVEERTEEEVSEYNPSPPRSPSPISSDDDCESHCNAEWRSLLKCPKCDQDCDSKSSFLEHLQLHSGKVKACKHCRKVFNNSMAFKFHKHLEMCLKSNKMFKCKLCNKTLFGGSQYNTHISAHKRNQCKICGDHFARKKHLETHTANVHNSSAGKNLFRCHVCERAFVQRRSLVYHFNQAHNERSGDHICPVCLDMFDSAELLEAHTASSHRPQIFTCDKCDNTFSRRQQYLVHMKTHERYKCETCSMGFSAKKAAVKHARQGHQVSGIETQLQCSLCGQLFCSRTLLKTHMILHTGGSSLTCEKCKITFKHERNYKGHLETEEHLRGEEPKNLLACKECNKTFTNKQNLRIHSIRMHKAGSKEHSCIHCTYKTGVLNNLKRHIALHTERPQFICDKCGAQFQTKNALQGHHLSMHSSTKEFSCDKCGKMFGRSSDLTRHLQNTHSETATYSCHCSNSYKTLSNLKRHQKLSHGKVELKQQRLKKLFLSENTDPPKKKVKTSKVKVEKSSTDVQIMDTQMPMNINTADTYERISPPAGEESEAVVMVTETHPEELLEVNYDMDFNAEDKAHIVYAQNLDMNALHVVESMIELDGDPAKQGASVLINVRNLFGRTLTNDFIMPSHFVSSVDVEDSLAEASQHTAVASQKPDVISSLQDYDIPHELSFLNA